MDSSAYLEALINRHITFRYARTSLAFDLTRSLFSSAGVDTGTLALLRELEPFLESSGENVIVDTGCGSGTLGISLAAASGAPLAASDRDALACWFTGRNAQLNKVDCATQTALGPVMPDPELIASSSKRICFAVCNIPAKAGEPVIRALVSAQSNLAAAAREGSLVGLVVVAPLAPMLIRQVDELGGTIVAKRETSSHLALVFTPARSSDGASGGDVRSDGELPRVYVRDRLSFDGPDGPYTMCVAHNLPEFDSLSYATELAFRLTRQQRPGGRLFAWGAGQGHILAGSLGSDRSASVTVADRDLLAIVTTCSNLESHVPGIVPVRKPAPCLAAAAETMPARETDWMILHGQPDPGSRFNEEVAQSAVHLLKPGGKILVVSRSTTIARLVPQLRSGFVQLESVRSRGFRADLIKRKH